MSFHKPTRLELAMHEAGHAYAFAALTRPNVPTELGLGIDDDGNHHGWCSRNVLLHNVPLSRVPADVLPHLRWAAAAEIVIAISGSTAEFRHRHRSRGGAGLLLQWNASRFLKQDAFDVDGDFDRIRSTFAYLMPDDPVAELQRLMEVSDAIVAANWPRIVKLGRHLFTRNTIGEDELFDWFQSHPVHRYASELSINANSKAHSVSIS